MTVGIAEKHCNQGIRRPWIFQGARPEAKRKNARERPESLDHGNERTFVDIFAEPSDTKEGQNSNGSAWYC